MPQPTDHVILAPESGLLPIGLLLALFALLLLAVLLEAVRRWRQRKRLLEAEWRRAEEIAKEKGISDPDWQGLRKVIARHRPPEPLKAVTVRQHFDACVETELAELEARGAHEAYAKVGARLRDLRTRLGLEFVPHGVAIHSTRELTPGQPLWMGTESGREKKWFRARVVEVDEAQFSATPWRRSGDALPRFEAGAEVRCHMWRDDDGRYAFTPRLVRFETAPPIWVFHHATQLERTQSREFYRLRISLETRVGVLRPVAAHDMAHLHQQPTLMETSAKITSLSGGGLALLVETAIAVQSVVRVPLKLPGETVFVVHVRALAVEHLERGRYRVRGSFLDIDEEARDDITRFIVQRQQLLQGGEGAGDRGPE